MKELVTGEAVVVDLAEARLASRAVALALDALVQAAALLGAVFGISALLGRADDQLLGALGLLGIPAAHAARSRRARRGQSSGVSIP